MQQTGRNELVGKQMKFWYWIVKTIEWYLKNMENNLKCSIIISVYKDTDSLDLIFVESLINQTIIPNEVIISEDGNSKEMVEYVKKGC